MTDGFSTAFTMAGSSLLADDSRVAWSLQSATDFPFEAGVLWGSADFPSEALVFLRAFSMALSRGVSHIPSPFSSLSEGMSI
ncbi:MAG: hypothetical protein E3J86_13875, partial [Candidatus Thorarchaeota archaeon]